MSIPVPISVAPLKGVVILPFSILYPSITEKLNSPVAGLTEPPPIYFAYNPFSVFEIISSLVDLPFSMKVFVILDVGAYLYDCLLVDPVASMFICLLYTSDAADEEDSVD